MRGVSTLLPPTLLIPPLRPRSVPGLPLDEGVVIVSGTFCLQLAGAEAPA
jgi:hypothetical protein